MKQMVIGVTQLVNQSVGLNCIGRLFLDIGLTLRCFIANMCVEAESNRTYKL